MGSGWGVEGGCLTKTYWLLHLLFHLLFNLLLEEYMRNRILNPAHTKAITANTLLPQKMQEGAPSSANQK